MVLNYIILNGKSSTYVQGLLIQSLPPITKPQMRTEIDVINGRDGDIVTPLGYSAYDKPFSVGLHGDYNIDDVIRFFDSEGVVTFSNEPYKYYKYTMIDQIDFERLARFRTATVTFHVQPFKWSLVEPTRFFVIYEGMTFVQIRNNGNTLSKPKITVYGDGNVSLKLNGTQTFNIDFSNHEEVTIDVNAMEASYNGQLMNRIVSGDYEKFMLKQGINTITWTGDLWEIDFDSYSRWI